MGKVLAFGQGGSGKWAERGKTFQVRMTALQRGRERARAWGSYSLAAAEHQRRHRKGGWGLVLKCLKCSSKTLRPRPTGHREPRAEGEGEVKPRLDEYVF